MFLLFISTPILPSSSSLSLCPPRRLSALFLRHASKYFNSFHFFFLISNIARPHSFWKTLMVLRPTLPRWDSTEAWGIRGNCSCLSNLSAAHFYRWLSVCLFFVTSHVFNLEFPHSILFHFPANCCCLSGSLQPLHSVTSLFTLMSPSDLGQISRFRAPCEVEKI